MKLFKIQKYSEICVFCRLNWSACLMPNASAIPQQDRGALDNLSVKGDGLSNQYAKWDRRVGGMEFIDSVPFLLKLVFIRSW